MKRTHLFGTVTACTLAAVVSVGAQDRPTASPSDESKTVVVTGCLKSGPASATATVGTSGSTASASARSSFIIADAVIKDPAATATTGATGTSGTAPAATTPGSPAGKTYSLVGGQATELTTLVNSKVEIKGTLEPKSPSAAASTPSTATPTTGMTASEHPQLKVTSVTKIEGSCSGQ
jgi:hypothetical protein